MRPGSEQPNQHWTHACDRLVEALVEELLVLLLANRGLDRLDLDATTVLGRLPRERASEYDALFVRQLIVEATRLRARIEGVPAAPLSLAQTMLSGWLLEEAYLQADLAGDCDPDRCRAELAVRLGPACCDRPAALEQAARALPVSCWLGE